uniref:Uncharacterized protein n=1 Tax=Parascaris equorum TaxID=6256 RepID=A0A914RM11_PAREQ
MSTVGYGDSVPQTVVGCYSWQAYWKRCDRMWCHGFGTSDHNHGKFSHGKQLHASCQVEGGKDNQEVRSAAE